MTLSEYLTRLALWLATRARRDETGASVVEYMALGILAIIVIVALIPGVNALAQKVLTYIGKQLGV